MWNPLDLKGPEFLVFYFGVAVAVNVAYPVLRWLLAISAEAPELSDPYLIAYLRGGRTEAVRAAMVSLIDRGLLTQDEGGATISANPSALEMARRPIEQAILSVFASPAPPWQALNASPAVDSACFALRDELRDMGLVRGGSAGVTERLLGWAAAAVLAGLAAAKIFVALQRGRTNIEFLVVLSLVALVVLGCVASGSRTALGSRALRQAKQRFSHLKYRASFLTPGGMTNEAVLLAAVFGLGALPAIAFPYARQIVQPATHSDGGSSCSGSSCSGSSCGGGGCGGGCGGCGG